MNTYKNFTSYVYSCFFAAKYAQGASDCTFIIKRGEVEVHSWTQKRPAAELYEAEVITLKELLKHVEKNIIPGSKVNIYGSDKNMIWKYNAEFRQNVNSEARKLLERLRSKYIIRLAHIPLKDNPSYKSA